MEIFKLCFRRANFWFLLRESTDSEMLEMVISLKPASYRFGTRTFSIRIFWDFVHKTLMYSDLSDREAKDGEQCFSFPSKRTAA